MVSANAVTVMGKVEAKVEGGSGDDELTLTADNVTVAAGAEIEAKVEGGSGEDLLTLNLGTNIAVDPDAEVELKVEDDD